MNVAPHRYGGRARWGLLFVVLALAGGAFALYRDYRTFAQTPFASTGATSGSVNIPRGATLPSILALLQPQPTHALYWRVLARELNVAGRLHAGEYALTPGLTPQGFLEKMAAGDVIQHHFTIVEGWTFKQLRQALAQDAGLTQTLAAVDDAEVMRRLGSGGAAAEGRFLPETYSYVMGMSDMDVLRRAHEAMQKTLDKLWSARAADLPLDSEYQALILASMVESAETAQSEERPQIAGVFLHRLKIGMRLQTDPSVIYGLGAGYDGKKAASARSGYGHALQYVHARWIDADADCLARTCGARSRATSGADRCLVLCRPRRRHA